MQLFFCFCLLFSPGLFAQNADGITEKDGKYGIDITYNSITKTAIKPRFDALKVLYRTTRPEFYMYKLKSKWGIITADDYNYKAYVITDPLFDEANYLSVTGLYEDVYRFLVTSDGKKAFLSFRILEKEKNYTLSEYFDEIELNTADYEKTYNLPFAVRKNGLYGIYNYKGDALVSVVYNKCQKLGNQHILTKDNESFLFRYYDKHTELMPLPAEKFWIENNNILFLKEGSQDTTIVMDGMITSAALHRKSLLIAQEKENNMVYEREVKSLMNQPSYKQLSRTIKGHTVYALGNKKGIHYEFRKRLEGEYDSIITVPLVDRRYAFLLFSSKGLQCFEFESNSILYPAKKLLGYWTDEEYLFLKTSDRKWIEYPYSKEYDENKVRNIENRFYIVTRETNMEKELRVLGCRNVFIPKEAEVVSLSCEKDAMTFIYRLNGKFGYESYTSGRDVPVRSLLPVFDSISYGYNNSYLKLIYQNQRYLVNYNDITAPKYNGHSLNCQPGETCGNPKCHGGLIGKTIIKEGKRVEATSTTKTLWSREWSSKCNCYVNVKSYETTYTPGYTEADKESTEYALCPHAVHNIKRIGLVSKNDRSGYDVRVITK